VRRRIDELCRAGAVSFEVDVDSAALGLPTHAYLWLSVEPGGLAEAGARIGAHPEIAYAGATTGPTNIYASLVCRDSQHLFEYLSTRLPTLPGVRAVETAPMIRTLKRTGRLYPGLEQASLATGSRRPAGG
jgi:DNA-binding Lrp family transcriptional regulator